MPVIPSGNPSRYPLVIGVVDGDTGRLRREIVRVIDDRGPADSAWLALSNFSAREDRKTKEIVVNLSRFFEHSTAEARDWTAAAYLYRIPVS